MYITSHICWPTLLPTDSVVPPTPPCIPKPYAVHRAHPERQRLRTRCQHHQDTGAPPQQDKGPCKGPAAALQNMAGEGPAAVAAKAFSGSAWVACLPQHPDNCGH